MLELPIKGSQHGELKATFPWCDRTEACSGMRANVYSYTIVHFCCCFFFFCTWIAKCPQCKLWLIYHLYTIQYRPIKNSNIKQVLGTSRRYSVLHSGVTWRGGQTAAGGGAGVLSDAAGGRGARQQVDAATSYINWLLQHGLTLSSLHAGQSLRCVKEPKSMKHNKKWTMPGNVLNRWYVIQSQGGGVCFLIDFIFSLADFFIFCIFSNWGNSTQSRLSTTSYGCGV